MLFLMLLCNCMCDKAVSNKLHCMSIERVIYDYFSPSAKCLKIGLGEGETMVPYARKATFKGSCIRST